MGIVQAVSYREMERETGKGTLEEKNGRKKFGRIKGMTTLLKSTLTFFGTECGVFNN